jgi:two-component system response regulator PfeR
MDGVAMPAPRKPVVLIIDSDETFAKQISRYLSKNCRLFFANTLRDGWILAAEQRPDVVLMEVKQVDGNGFQWIQSARSKPWSKAMAIACVTVCGAVQDKIMGFRMGADDYLVKPIDMDMIYARVILLIRSRKMSFTFTSP